MNGEVVYGEAEVAVIIKKLWIKEGKPRLQIDIPDVYGISFARAENEMINVILEKVGTLQEVREKLRQQGEVIIEKECILRLKL